jgi:adenylyl-sulfate reductase (glutathione)
MAATCLSSTFTTAAAAAAGASGARKGTGAAARKATSSTSVRASSSSTSASRNVADAAAAATKVDTTTIDWEALDAEIADQTTIQILDRALEIFGDELAIAFSGAEVGLGTAPTSPLFTFFCNRNTIRLMTAG